MFKRISDEEIGSLFYMRNGSLNEMGLWTEFLKMLCAVAEAQLQSCQKQLEELVGEDEELAVVEKCKPLEEVEVEIGYRGLREWIRDNLGLSTLESYENALRKLGQQELGFQRVIRKIECK